jgi:hypothetical protein
VGGSPSTKDFFFANGKEWVIPLRPKTNGEGTLGSSFTQFVNLKQRTSEQHSLNMAGFFAFEFEISFVEFFD